MDVGVSERPRPGLRVGQDIAARCDDRGASRMVGGCIRGGLGVGTHRRVGVSPACRPHRGVRPDWHHCKSAHDEDSWLHASRLDDRPRPADAAPPVASGGQAGSHFQSAAGRTPEHGSRRCYQSWRTSRATDVTARTDLEHSVRYLSLICFFVITSVANAEPLKAGAARIDITPPTGYPMWGYAARKDAPSVGVRNPLQARAAVLAVGNDKVAFVSLDLGRPPTRNSMANIRKSLKAATGIETIFLVASHTHHGPVLELDDWPKKEKPYVRVLEEKIVKVITDADKALQPTKLGISSHEIPFNRNRHSKKPNPPVDKEMIIIRLDDAKGKPIAHLVHFAAHPTMLPHKLHEFSHD